MVRLSVRIYQRPLRGAARKVSGDSVLVPPIFLRLLICVPVFLEVAIFRS